MCADLTCQCRCGIHIHIVFKFQSLGSPGLWHLREQITAKGVFSRIIKHYQGACAYPAKPPQPTLYYYEKINHLTSGKQDKRVKNLTNNMSTDSDRVRKCTATKSRTFNCNILTKHISSGPGN